MQSVPEPVFNGYEDDNTYVKAEGRQKGIVDVGSELTSTMLSC